MITWNNALTHVAAWCKANPGQRHTITAEQLARMGKTPESLKAWTATNGLQAVPGPRNEAEPCWHISTTTESP